MLVDIERVKAILLNAWQSIERTNARDECDDLETDVYDIVQAYDEIIQILDWYNAQNQNDLTNAVVSTEGTSAEAAIAHVNNTDKWDKRFIELCKLVASWSSCYKPDRSVGAIIVKDKRILTTGYNGAPSGIPSCKDKKCCIRVDMSIPSGTRHEFCYAVHAEQNAIIQAAKLGISVEGATLYCTHFPCTICAKMIANAGIQRVVYVEDYPDEFSHSILNNAKVQLYKYMEEC